jgi:hypothetical protein
MSDKTSQEIIARNLKDIKDVFKCRDIQCWLDWGTLLGAMRSGKIIEWDHDADLGVTAGNLEKIISVLSEIEKKGFTIIRAPISASELTFRRDGYGIDVWLYYPVDKNLLAMSYYMLSTNWTAHMWWFLWRVMAPAYGEADLPQKGIKSIIKRCFQHSLQLLPNGIKKSIVKSIKKRLVNGDYILRKEAVAPKEFLEKFKTMIFYGETFDIPYDAEGYLEYKYGETWRIPIREWNPWTEDGSVILAEKREMHEDK